MLYNKSYITRLNCLSSFGHSRNLTLIIKSPGKYFSQQYPIKLAAQDAIFVSLKNSTSSMLKTA